MKLPVIGGPADGDEVDLDEPFQPGEELTLTVQQGRNKNKRVYVRYIITEDATLEFEGYETI